MVRILCMVINGGWKHLFMPFMRNKSEGFRVYFRTLDRKGEVCAEFKIL